jgi:hypothetical protein
MRRRVKLSAAPIEARKAVGRANIMARYAGLGTADSTEEEMRVAALAVLDDDDASARHQPARWVLQYLDEANQLLLRAVAL